MTTRTEATRKLDVEVREDLASTPDYPHWKAIVTDARGRCRYAVYAGERPSDEKVRADWLADRGTSRAGNWTPGY